MVQTLVQTFKLVRIGIRNGCLADKCFGQTQQRRLPQRSLSSNPKPGLDASAVVLDVEVFDIRVGGRKLTVREVSYR